MLNNNYDSSYPTNDLKAELLEKLNHYEIRQGYLSFILRLKRVLRDHSENPELPKMCTVIIEHIVSENKILQKLLHISSPLNLFFNVHVPLLPDTHLKKVIRLLNYSYKS